MHCAGIRRCILVLLLKIESDYFTLNCDASL